MSSVDAPGGPSAHPGLLPEPESEGETDPDPAGLEQEVAEIRSHLGGLVSELDRRRRRLTPKALVTNNPVAVMVAAAALLGLCAAGVAWRIAHRRKERALLARARRWRHAFAEALVAPDAAVVAPPRPGFPMKVLTAAGAAAAAVVARRLAEQAFQSRRPRS